MTDQEPVGIDVSRGYGNDPADLPPAKMVRLDELEQTVMGLVKKSLEQAGQSTMSHDELSGSGSTQITAGQ